MLRGEAVEGQHFGSRHVAANELGNWARFLGRKQLPAHRRGKLQVVLEGFLRAGDGTFGSRDSIGICAR